MVVTVVMQVGEMGREVVRRVERELGCRRMGGGGRRRRMRVGGRRGGRDCFRMGRRHLQGRDTRPIGRVWLGADRLSRLMMRVRPAGADGVGRAALVAPAVSPSSASPSDAPSTLAHEPPWTALRVGKHTVRVA